LTYGIGYQNHSEQHRARRPSSEDSCQPNSKTKQRLEESKDGNSSDTKESKKNNDPTEMNTTKMMEPGHG
jgi:hypothetical protein